MEQRKSNENDCNDNNNYDDSTEDPDIGKNQTNCDPVIVKSEPQNDSEYYSAANTGSYDRLSNQSFSSEGETTSFHDNSQHYEYQGEDIAEESFSLSNSELYGDDYIGSPLGTPGKILYNI